MHGICMYTPSADGGHALYTHELLTALRSASARGQCRFELVTSVDLMPRFESDDYTVQKILPPLVDRRSFPTRVHWVASRLLHYQKRELRLYRWLKTRPDITTVHFQEWTPWLASTLIKRIRARGMRVFYTVHNIMPHRYPKRIPKSLMHRWIRNACRSCDGLFVHTELLADQLSQFLQGRHPPIQVVPHGVWTVAEPPDVLPLSARMPQKKLLFFGSIRRNKGLNLLLRAMPLLPEYSLTIAGERLEHDYFSDEVEPAVRQLQAKGVRIDLQARYIREDEIPNLFTTHSAIVLPYTSGFVAQSGVAFMALAYELPMVASNAGGIGELIRSYRVGTIFEESTPQKLAEAIRSIHAQDPEFFQARMREAKRHYSWRAAAAATMEAYLSAGHVVTGNNVSAVETTSTTAAR